MRIGVDIDGVLTDIYNYMLDYGSKFFIDLKGRHISNPNAYDSDEIFGATQAEDIEFWNSDFNHYSWTAPRPFACEVLNRLKLEGHEICVITNRANGEDSTFFSDESMKKIVARWLKKYKLNYDKLIFSTGNKLAEIKENKIDVMIDDAPSNVLALSKIIKVLCYDCRYNQNLEGKNITRVFSWYDIYDKIKNIKSL